MIKPAPVTVVITVLMWMVGVALSQAVASNAAAGGAGTDRPAITSPPASSDTALPTGTGYSSDKEALSAPRWNTGLRITVVADPVIGRDIRVAWWYPTEAGMRDEAIGPARLTVALDSEPVKDLKGIILISHGFSGSFLGHNLTARALAEAGYLVVAPTHPDRAGLNAGQPQLDPLVMRPRQLSLVLDVALKDPRYTATNSIGILGYSLGTYSALVALGATADPDNRLDYCRQRPANGLLCSPGAGHRFRAIASLLQTQPDLRIGAAVLLAPAYGPLFSHQSLAQVRVPVLLYRAEKDEELEHQFNADHISAGLADSEPLRTVRNAGHYSFMSPCPDSIAARIPAVCRDAAGLDRREINRRVNREVVAFFQRRLKPDS